MTRSRLSSLTVVSFALAAFVVQVAVANGSPLLRLRAFAVNLSGPAPVRTGTLDITIERWSTPAEAAKLRDVLTEKGADALLETLQKMPRTGSIQRTGRLGWDIHFAQQVVAPPARAGPSARSRCRSWN